VCGSLVTVSGQSSSSSTGPAPPTYTGICDRLAAANGYDHTNYVAEVNFMTAFIGRVAFGNGTGLGVFKDPTTKNFFNGVNNYRTYGSVAQPFASQTPGYSPNFNTDVGAQATLVDHLVRFFGSSNALHCSAADFPTYSSTTTPFGVFNQYQVHANMNITATAFAGFNAQVINAASSFGATAAEQSTITAVLATFGRNNAAGGQTNEICTQIGCPCATGLTGGNCDQPVGSASAVQVSFITLGVFAIISLILAGGF
jgi:hypothetical protein